MTENELLREQWCQVAQALSIEIIAPFFLALPDGKKYEFACLLPQFGSEKGTLINNEHSAELFEIAVTCGYAISSMAAEHHHIPINAEDYIECLTDWGWACSAQEPRWYKNAT